MWDWSFLYEDLNSVLYMLGKHSVTEIYSQSKNVDFVLSFEIASYLA